MGSNWSIVRVGDLADSISETHKFEKDYLIFLNTSDVLLGKLLHNLYSEVKNWPGQAKKSIKKDDILFSEIRPANGRWAYIDFEADDYVVSTKLMVIRTRTSRVLPKFFYYFLTSSGITWELQHLAESRSGTFPQITFDQVSELELSLPPVPVQKIIVSFLDTLDDKIELNRRMNETLEAMARSIFNSWFVDFDPVRFKAEGRDPGLPKPLADLFPDSLVGSELGAIPKGWQIRTVGDLADVVGGSTPSTKNPIFWTGGIHNWATPKDLAALNAPVLLDTERRITDAGLTQISSGLLPRGTVLLSSRAPIGYLAISEVAVAINQGFIALKPKGCVSNIYLLLWANFAHDEIISRANGTTFLEISKACFRPIPLVEPPAKVLEAFDIQIRRLFNRIVLNERESRVLTSLRETLLPKLISGEFKLAKGWSNG